MKALHGDGVVISIVVVMMVVQKLEKAQAESTTQGDACHQKNDQ
jgi:hypothetical protein